MHNGITLWSVVFLASMGRIKRELSAFPFLKNGELSDPLLLVSAVQDPSRKLCENSCEKQRAETDTSRQLYGRFLGCVSYS
jgi:hypothetical protein